MVVRELTTTTGSSSSSSSSIAPNRRKYIFRSMGPKKPKLTPVKNRADDPSMPYVTQALNCYNQTSPQKYKLVEPGCLNPVCLVNYFLFHVDFVAKNTDVPHAPNEMFFAELIMPSAPIPDKLPSVSLCVSIGPTNSISGDILNGCYYCRAYNNVHHPKGGGFVRGGDKLYKTVEDICGIELNNEENHLPMLKQVSQANEPKNEGEYTSEQVEDARPYATEAMTFFNQLTHRGYKLVEPGFITRVILPTCLLFHVNFTAKETDVAGAPEMFFAELTSTAEVLSCKLCVRLHPADSVLGDKMNGCYYCRKYNNVQHPKGGDFVRGGDSLYKKIS